MQNNVWQCSVCGHQNLVEHNGSSHCPTCMQNVAVLLVYTKPQSRQLAINELPAKSLMVLPKAPGVRSPTRSILSRSNEEAPLSSSRNQHSHNQPISLSAFSIKWPPGAIAGVAFICTFALGKWRDAAGFLGSKTDNLTATMYSAAAISFVLYCLSHGARGHGRIFARAACLGGFLWVSVGAPGFYHVSSGTGNDSKILVHLFPFSAVNAMSADDIKSLIGFSVLLAPFIAGVTGRWIAMVGAVNPIQPRSMLLVIYIGMLAVVWIGVVIIRS